MVDSVIAYIGLGSNLEEPISQIRLALQELDALDTCQLLEHSSLYRSEPIGPPGQPDYINAVAKIDTSLQPLELLDVLQGLERQHHRIRRERWGPRTLDLDLLLYADQLIEHPRLTVPHCRIAERAFVCYPWLEISPGQVIPGMGRLKDLATGLSAQGLERLGE